MEVTTKITFRFYSIHSFSFSSIFLSPATAFGVHGLQHVTQPSHSQKIQRANPDLVQVHLWVLHECSDEKPQ